MSKDAAERLSFVFSQCLDTAGLKPARGLLIELENSLS